MIGSATPQVWRAIRLVSMLVVSALFALACSPGQPSSVVWRNIEVELPDGWFVFEETDDLLSISNVDLARHAEDQTFPDEDVVAMFFTYEPGASPRDWRELVDRRGGVLETDDRLELQDEIPATRLIYSDTSAGMPTREMVVLIPSRAVVVLAQPVPRPGQQDAPEVFLEHVGEFLNVVQTLELGRPVLDEGLPGA